MKHFKDIYTETKDVKKASYIWNTMSATLFAVQSAIVLIVITHTVGLEDAGIFSIAYAVGSLMYYIGEYGVRKYQVSDVAEEMSFTDYHSHRVTSSAIMLIASVVYIMMQDYSPRKAYIVLMVCLLKVVEAYSELYFGRFQQVGRLDVSSKTNLFRTGIAMAACMISLVVTHDMAISMTVWFVVALICFFLSSFIVYPEFGEIRWSFKWNKIFKIYKDCLPLFLGYFLLLYVGNAPKYAIDACMSDLDQACYNFIFMPVFAIGLFANFIFNPILVDLAHKWEDGEIKAFKKIVIRQIFVILAITLLAIGVAATIGCPILGWLYNADLATYKIDLMILMVGGGMLALVNFFTVVVTVMREQKYLMIGYIAAAVVALLMTNKVVATYGIRGATIFYSVLMTIATIVFAAVMMVFIKRKETASL